MRISLLAHNLRVAGGLTGGRNLLKALVEIAPGHDYQVFIPDGCGYQIDRPNVTAIPVPAMGMGRRMLFDLVQLPRLVARFCPDLVWGLGNMGLKRPPCRQAILVRDAHLIYPKRHYEMELARCRFSKYLVKRHLIACLPSTEVVFCQTRTMAERFARKMPLAGRICLCPNALSAFLDAPTNPRPPAALEPFMNRFKLFALTKYCAHKNLEGIVRMYHQFRNELAGTLCVLTISADQHPRVPALLRRIQQLDLGHLIVNVGPLTQQQLAAHYLACDAMFLPTLLESFSATYLEAMHFGRPIITSDLDFAREVCGEAAVYVDPWDSRSMKDRIGELAGAPQRQQELVEHGRQRLSRLFRSWPDVARQALDDLGVPHE